MTKLLYCEPASESYVLMDVCLQKFRQPSDLQPMVKAELYRCIATSCSLDVLTLLLQLAVLSHSIGSVHDRSAASWYM